MVTDHLDLLQSHRFTDIAKAMKLPVEQVIEHCEIIRRLDPQPGSKFNTEKSHYVTPDVYVLKVDGKYEVVLNEDRLPQLRISSVYKRMLENKSDDNAATRDYVKEKLRSALWLIKSVDQRQKTIYKVANSIVRQQQEFLDNGVEHLRPMVLRDVAIDIGMHESTVSRVVSNKYIHTPQGVFEMRYFFHSGIASTGGEHVSSVTIKQRIRKIVEEENPKRPLSDSKIVKILEDEGLVLARRTIAKYREELRIPPSNQRKNLYSSPFAS
jgi:RNA polymerase sigma-54 factor